MDPKRAATRVLLAGLCLLAAAFVRPVSAQQPPPLPHAFYGAVEVNGEPAPVGTQVEARGAGVLTGVSGNPITVTQAGQYGGPGGFDPKLVVQGQVADSTPMEFYVDGVRAQCAVPGGPWQESYPFKSGMITELNLKVVGPAATSTPTLLPTVEPTLTPSPTAGPAVIVPSPTPTPGATSTPTLPPPSATPFTMVVPTPTSSPPAPSPTPMASPTAVIPASTPTPLPTALPLFPTPTPMASPTAVIPAATPTPLPTALPLFPAPTATATSTPSVLPLLPTETRPLPTLPQQQVTTPATVTAAITTQATKSGVPSKPVETPTTLVPEGASESGGIPALWIGALMFLIVCAVVLVVIVVRGIR
ncbi:MAG: hypothetical protein WBW48_10020 [Anaerolineae bacterium]